MKNNRLTLKSQQRFRSKKHNAFRETINKIALIAKRIQSINSMEAYAYKTNKEMKDKKKKMDVLI